MATQFDLDAALEDLGLNRDADGIMLERMLQVAMAAVNAEAGALSFKHDDHYHVICDHAWPLDACWQLPGTTAGEGSLITLPAVQAVSFRSHDWRLLHSDLRIHTTGGDLGLSLALRDKRLDRDRLPVLRQCTEMLEYTFLAKHRTVYDALTGCYCRRHILERLEQEWRRIQRQEQHLAVGMLDLDHFKSINDGFGHPEGDQALTRVAETLRRELRRAGDAVGRYGGEEFLVIMPDTSEAAARLVIERVREAVQDLAIAYPDSEAGTLSISSGIAAVQLYGHSSLNREMLIQAADAALLQAKRDGRNRVVAWSDLAQQPFSLNDPLAARRAGHAA